MPVPTCPKCANTTFVLSPIVLVAAKPDHTLKAVCCSSCGAVVSVVEDVSLTQSLAQIDSALVKIARALKISL